MVETVQTDTGDVYVCEQCGERFDEVATAAEHEASCGPPRSM